MGIIQLNQNFDSTIATLSQQAWNNQKEEDTAFDFWEFIKDRYTNKSTWRSHLIEFLEDYFSPWELGDLVDWLNEALRNGIGEDSPKLFEENEITLEHIEDYIMVKTLFDDVFAWFEESLVV